MHVVESGIAYTVDEVKEFPNSYLFYFKGIVG